ncbi:MAG: hypothetical protein LBI95_02690 [Holosporales bacterium]|nr:hypothetical protein [Holosporales bacterium]
MVYHLSRLGQAGFTIAHRRKLTPRFSSPLLNLDGIFDTIGDVSSRCFKFGNT